MSGYLNRRNTAADISLHATCPRCKRLEIDYATAKDQLNATDSELKASRQVISLLQRQLELFQVKKEGLEQLIVSAQSRSVLEHESSLGVIGHDSNDTIIPPAAADESNECQKSNERKLLSLIKTQLYSKDEEILKLRSSLKEALNEKEQEGLQRSMLEDDLAKLKAENTLLKENLTLRDSTIQSLSAELFERSTNISPDRRLSSATDSVHNSGELEIIKTKQKQISHLNDTLDAYKRTNQLLSTNVINLTERCNEAERKEIESRSQCHELEAKCCQIQSKLLSLLKEIEQSSNASIDNSNCAHESDLDQSETISKSNAGRGEFIQSQSVRLLIRRLLEDKSLDIPLSWKEGNKSQRSKGEVVRKAHKMGECDELGFYILDSHNSLASSNATETSSTSNHKQPHFNLVKSSPTRGLSKFSSDACGLYHLTSTSSLDTVGEEPEEALDGDMLAVVGHQRALKTKRARDECDQWRLKWDDFMTSFDNTDLTNCKEFKDMLRSGVPQEYRCKVWKALVEMRIGKEREKRGPDYYQSLLQPAAVRRASGEQAPPQPCSAVQNPSTKQIELDLLRTLPNNKYFETIDSSGTIRLRRVLTAFSGYKPEVGYCQGMNRLAAVALLVLPEEEAFWCLVAIVDRIMPVGYYNDLWLAQVDSNVVMDLVAVKMPHLGEHFKRHHIELSLFASFLTIFVDGTPPSLFLRLWDCFLYEGDKVLFRAALALLKEHEKELLEMDNSVAVNNFVRSCVNGPLDIESFFKVAFHTVNPLPGRLLRNRREQAFSAMRSSLSSQRSSQTSHASEKATKSNESLDAHCEGDGRPADV